MVSFMVHIRLFLYFYLKKLNTHVICCFFFIRHYKNTPLQVSLYARVEYGFVNLQMRKTQINKLPYSTKTLKSWNILRVCREN